MLIRTRPGKIVGHLPVQRQGRAHAEETDPREPEACECRPRLVPAVSRVEVRRIVLSVEHGNDCSMVMFHPPTFSLFGGRVERGGSAWLKLTMGQEGANIYITKIQIENYKNQNLK